LSPSDKNPEGIMPIFADASVVPWSKNKAECTKIVIKDFVNIGDYAFDSFENVQSVEFVTKKRSLKKIHFRAFFDCIKLTTLTLPDGLEQIDVDAFQKCTGLTSISLPNTLKKIMVDAFWGCEKLENIIFSNKISELTVVPIPNDTSNKNAPFHNCPITNLYYSGESDPCTTLDADLPFLPSTINNNLYVSNFFKGDGICGAKVKGNTKQDLKCDAPLVCAASDNYCTSNGDTCYRSCDTYSDDTCKDNTYCQWLKGADGSKYTCSKKCDLYSADTCDKDQEHCQVFGSGDSAVCDLKCSYYEEDACAKDSHCEWFGSKGCSDKCSSKKEDECKKDTTHCQWLKDADNEEYTCCIILAYYFYFYFLAKKCDTYYSTTCEKDQEHCQVFGSGDSAVCGLKCSYYEKEDACAKDSHCDWFGSKGCSDKCSSKKEDECKKDTTHCQWLKDADNEEYTCCIILAYYFYFYFLAKKCDTYYSTTCEKDQEHCQVFGSGDSAVCGLKCSYYEKDACAKDSHCEWFGSKGCCMNNDFLFLFFS